MRSLLVKKALMSSESVASGPDYQRVVELIRKGSSPLVFTCEHGGQQDFWLRPTLFRNQAARLTGTHWAFDPGAAELTRDLCARTRSRGIVCHVTRLFCDVNRPPGSETLARRFCDEVEIEENRDMLDEKERRMRIEKVWVPFHVRAAALANEFDTKIASVIAGMEIQSTMKLTTCIIKKKIASIHSFNPVYEGSTRDHVQIGILSSFDDSVALKVIDQLRKDGFTKVIHNEPWSGKKGLMYSPDQLAISGPKPRRSVTVEVRNDLLDRSKAENVEYIRRLVESLSVALLDEAGSSTSCL